MRPRSRGAALAVLALSLAADSRTLAKAPTLSGLFPAGVARGQTVKVAASGSFDHWPVKGWAEGDGLAIEAGPEKGKLEIRVADDAVPGVRWVRLYDEDGATALRPFVVGTLPEFVEAEPNDDPRKPQGIPGPSATVNGRLAARGDVDGFSLRLRRGETLVADLEANRHLGSPMDAVLQVVSASGFVLAQNDDAIGRDPRIVFQAPADGAYTIRVFAFPATPDSSIRFAGGETFVYRLTLTTGGFLDHPFPLAVSRDGHVTVAAIGPNILETARMLAISNEGGRDVRRVWHPLLAGTAEVRVVDGSSTIEAEPAETANPQEVPPQGAISGRIDAPGDRDTFRIALKKGEKRIVRVESRGLGLPLDPVLRITDSAGKSLAEVDDAKGGRDPEIAFLAPVDGEYHVLVRDLNDRGGPSFAYLLRILGPEPDFSLTLAADRFDATPGKTSSVVVSIERKDGFAGSIDVVAEGLPDGVAAAPAVSKAGDPSAKSVTLTLTADGCSHPGPFRVVGKAGERLSPRVAVAAIAGFAAETDRPWLTIRTPSDPGKP